MIVAVLDQVLPYNVNLIKATFSVKVYEVVFFHFTIVVTVKTYNVLCSSVFRTAFFFSSTSNKLTDLLNPHNPFSWIIRVCNGIHIEQLREDKVGSRIYVCSFFVH